jgi:GABA permease
VSKITVGIPSEPVKNAAPPSSGLRHSLKQRHMTMIALGGVIGAGLFVGSGVVIKSAGPAAVISFMLTGLLVVLVMRMLGEMAVALPAVGSFYEYARLAWSDRPRLGELAGFFTGWMYWYFWVIVVALETVAGAGLVRFWLPSAPGWFVSLVLLLLLTLTNLISVRSYGEFEFWFASIKVASIVGFLILAGMYVLGLWPGVGLGVANLTAHGGFAPNGVLPILTGAVAATGFYFGAEIVTIAAAEAAEPAKAVARATNSVISRALLFYVGSIFLVVCLVPWNSAAIATPYVSALSAMGIPAAAQIIGGAHCRAVGAQFGFICIVTNVVRVDPSRRCSARSRPAQPQRRAVPRNSARDAVRLRRRGHVVRLAGHRIRFSGQLLRHGGDIRVRVDRPLGIAIARALGTRGPGAASRAHVGVSVPDLCGDRRDARHPVGDGLHPRAANPPHIRSRQPRHSAAWFLRQDALRSKAGYGTAQERVPSLPGTVEGCHNCVMTSLLP